MDRVLQPRPLVVLGLNVWMGTAAGADELVEVPYRKSRPGPRRTPFFLSTSTSLDERGHLASGPLKNDMTSSRGYRGTSLMRNAPP